MSNNKPTHIAYTVRDFTKSTEKQILMEPHWGCVPA